MKRLSGVAVAVVLAVAGLSGCAITGPPTGSQPPSVPTRLVPAASPSQPTPMAPLVLGERSSERMAYPVVAEGPYAGSVNALIEEQVRDLESYWDDSDEVTMSYEVLMNEAGILSLRFWGMWNVLTAAHPNNFVRLFSFDVAAGKRLTLTEHVAIDRRFVDELHDAWNADWRAELGDEAESSYQSIDEYYSAQGLLELARDADTMTPFGASEMESALVPGGIMVTVSVPHVIGDERVLQLRDDRLTLVAATPGAPAYRTELVTRTFTTKLGTYTLTYSAPVVTGVLASVAKEIDDQVTEFFEARIAAQVETDVDCVLEPVPEDDSYDRYSLNGATEGGLYQGRYVSLYLFSGDSGCDEPIGSTHTRWLTLDVTTGEEVPLSAFARTDGDRFAYAVGIAPGEEQGCWSGTETCSGTVDTRRPDLPSWRDPDGWTVSDLGITASYQWEDWVDSYLVPWESIDAPGAGAAAVTTEAVPATAGDPVTVTQDGTLVTVTDGLDHWNGIRPVGSDTARLFLLSEEESGDLSYVPGYRVRFESATSPKAVEAEIRGI